MAGVDVSHYLKSIGIRLENWKRCIDGDDFSRPEIVRSHFNDLYLILSEFVAILDEKCPTGNSSPKKLEASVTDVRSY